MSEEGQSVPKQEKKNNKSAILIGAILVAFIVVVTGIMHMDWGPDPIEVMRNQLEELDSDSYSDIKGWVDDEFPEFEEELEGFQLFVRAFTTEGDLIEKGFLSLEPRFIEWQYELDEYRLEIELTYLTMDEYITKQLSELERTSLEAISQWIRDNEGEGNPIIRTQTTNRDGEFIQHFDIEESEIFFVEWDFEVLDGQRNIQVNIEYIYDVRKTFFLGETFEFGGMKFTFLEDIWGGRVDNYWSLDDGQAYFAVPVVVENISDEDIRIMRFEFTRFDSDGLEIGLFNPGYHDMISLAGEIRPGTTREGYLYFKYTGEGDYAVKMSHPDLINPFEVEVIIPVSDLDIPEIEDRYNRDVPIPDVVVGLHEFTLFNHALAVDSSFYTTPYTTELGNTYILLRPGEVVRDPEGVITHDSLQVSYHFYEVCEEMFEEGFEVAEVLEHLAWRAQQGGNPGTTVGDIRVNEDRTSGFLHIRRGVGLDLQTRFFIVQLLPGGNEYVILETWLWTIDRNVVGRRAKGCSGRVWPTHRDRFYRNNERDL